MLDQLEQLGRDWFYVSQGVGIVLLISVLGGLSIYGLGCGISLLLKKLTKLFPFKRR